MKKVGLKILKLLFEYSRNNKLVDKEYIDKLVEIVVSERGLDEYVGSIEWSPKVSEDAENIEIAGYNPLLKYIVINYNEVNNSLEKKRKYECLFNDLEIAMYRNILITQVILHELEHAYQVKISNDYKDRTLYATLARVEFNIEKVIKFKNIKPEHMNAYLEYHNQKYKENYYINPIERLAQANSIRLIINMLDEIVKYVPNLKEYMMAGCIENVTRNYDTVWNQGFTCPTEAYLKNLGYEDIWVNFDFFNENPNILLDNVKRKFQFMDSLSYGLPVEFENYSFSIDWLRNTNKYSI